VKVLYLTYDGLLEPLGQSQVLPYVRILARKGVEVHLLSFEKPRDLAEGRGRDELAASLAQDGISWTPLRYHKRPSALSTMYDIGRGALEAVSICRRCGIRLLHARSYVPQLMAWLATRLIPARTLFDMRGFWVDERVEGGIWPATGALFRLGKWWERRLLSNAHGLVVLAGAAIPHLERLAGRPIQVPVEVVPTCANLQRFRPAPDRASLRRELGLQIEGFVLLYVGSLGTWYLGPETFKMAEAMSRLMDDFTFVVLTRETERARALIPPALADRTIVRTVSHTEVPRWMAAADSGLSLVRPTFSKIASCPTKLGEYLACGLPVASTSGIGDVEEFLSDGCGVLVGEGSEEELDRGATALFELSLAPGVADRCRALAIDHFSLEMGVERYLALYRRLLEGE
jgi:glycosyltransferase involved in cell wall biosynthesis